MGLLKFLFLAILVLWIIRLLVRLIFPMVVRNAFNMQDPAAQAQEQRRRRPEGSISIDYMPKRERKGNPDKLGEFVDYEEVK